MLSFPSRVSRRGRVPAGVRGVSALRLRAARRRAPLLTRPSPHAPHAVCEVAPPSCRVSPPCFASRRLRRLRKGQKDGGDLSLSPPSFSTFHKWCNVTCLHVSRRSFLHCHWTFWRKGKLLSVLAVRRACPSGSWRRPALGRGTRFPRGRSWRRRPEVQVSVSSS